jgi:phage gp16-like protein
MAGFTSRRSLLAQIHMAVKELAMTDDAYRGMLQERYGVASAGKLAMPLLRDLVAHFEKLGWVPKRKPEPRPDIKRLCKRIWAQCYSLGRPVPEYGDAISRQMFGIDKVVWCDAEQLRAITTALAKQQDVEGAETE